MSDGVSGRESDGVGDRREKFVAPNPDFEARVRDSFSRQSFMALIGAELVRLQPGYCEIRLTYREQLSQQHGFFHGGIIGALADNAAGYASFSLMPAGASVLTVEYKLNFLAPGDGDLLISRARVIKPGRSLIVAQSDVAVSGNGEEKHCATALVTMMTLHDSPDHPPEDSRHEQD